MANLMITKQCNLHCSYCFANEFVNKQKDIMSFENFMKCMKFLSYNPKERIGLIGGEPTTHPELDKILAAIIDSPFRSACLFTNGILLDQFINELRNARFQILINLNSPENIGRDAFDRIIDNMDEIPPNSNIIYFSLKWIMNTCWKCWRDFVLQKYVFQLRFLIWKKEGR